MLGGGRHLSARYDLSAVVAGSQDAIVILFDRYGKLVSASLDASCATMERQKQ
jgi:hypothetical protein